MIALGDLPGGAFSSSARGVSADGSVIVGDGASASGFEAFRWTSGGGMAGLGDLPGGSFVSVAWDTSADGSVVVGWSESSAGAEAFFWSALVGMQSLREMLVAGGATGLTGWTLIEALAVSDDGRTILGHGINPLGQTEAWIATVPEPSTLVLGTVGVALLAAVASQRRCAA
jgi:probable HAF family extracellular repeat protein